MCRGAARGGLDDRVHFAVTRRRLAAAAAGGQRTQFRLAQPVSALCSASDCAQHDKQAGLRLHLRLAPGALVLSPRPRCNSNRIRSSEVISAAMITNRRAWKGSPAAAAALPPPPPLRQPCRRRRGNLAAAATATLPPPQHTSLTLSLTPPSPMQQFGCRKELAPPQWRPPRRRGASCSSVAMAIRVCFKWWTRRCRRARRGRCCWT